MNSRSDIHQKISVAVTLSPLKSPRSHNLYKSRSIYLSPRPCFGKGGEIPESLHYTHVALVPQLRVAASCLLVHTDEFMSEKQERDRESHRVQRRGVRALPPLCCCAAKRAERVCVEFSSACTWNFDKCFFFSPHARLFSQRWKQGF